MAKTVELGGRTYTNVSSVSIGGQTFVDGTEDFEEVFSDVLTLTLTGLEAAAVNNVVQAIETGLSLAGKDWIAFFVGNTDDSVYKAVSMIHTAGANTYKRGTDSQYKSYNIGYYFYISDNTVAHVYVLN